MMNSISLCKSGEAREGHKAGQSDNQGPSYHKDEADKTNV